MLIKEMSSDQKLKALLDLFYQGKSLEEITRIAGYQKKSNVKDFLKSKGYQFDKDIIINVHSVGHAHDMLLTQSNNTSQVSVDRHKTDNFLLKELENKNLQRDLIALAKQYNEIQEALLKIKSFDSYMADNPKEVVIVEEGIKIDLTDYEGPAYISSIRINPIIWKRFDEFASQHKEFDKASLIAQAMKDYMEKHK